MSRPSRGPGAPTQATNRDAAAEVAGPADATRLAEELRYQRDLVRTITDNAATALFMMDRNGFPIFMNPAACAMTGYSGLDEIRGRPLHESVHFRKPDGSPYPMHECPIDRANAEIRALKDQRETFCRKDGTLFPVRYNVAPIERDGERLGAVIEVRDITEEVRLEKERARLLHEAEAAREKLHALFIQAPAAIAMVDGPNHVFSFVNTRYEELVGRPSRELLGRAAGEAFPELVQQGFIAILDGVRASGKGFEAFGSPVTLKGPEGPRLTYHNFTYQPVRGDSGTVDSILGIAIDVTPQVLAQQRMEALAGELEARVGERTRQVEAQNRELARANEMLESFTYVVGHDLKEPVRAIEAYLGAAADARDAAEHAELVAQAREANRRQHALLRGLLELSRVTAEPLELRDLDLAETLATLARPYYETLTRETGADVQLGELPRVRGNEVLLAQLFGNLVLNAIRHNGSAQRRVRVHAERAAEGTVDVLVDDNGPGFPEDVKALVARLGTSAPSSLRGGFGLAIAHRAATRLGGSLCLESSPWGGGRVRVRLPTAGA